MFITLQFPFVDVRRFLKYPPKLVPRRNDDPKPNILDLQKIAKEEYVRCFGPYRKRSYTPDFKSKIRIYTPAEDAYQDLNLNDIWQDEYLYASTHRGLRFETLEKQSLLQGKLHSPRAKIRALRFSPFTPAKTLWSPCMRIETGILFSIKEPLEEDELINAIQEFLKLKVTVPVYKREGAGKNAVVKKSFHQDTLLAQQKALATLMVSGTTAQDVLRVHDSMILPGEPLLTIHHEAGEIKSFPSNVMSLPKKLSENLKIRYHPLKKPMMGVWMFEVPTDYLTKKTLEKKREIIRNNTIAIMRYWSELQAIIAFRNAIATDKFEFSIKENSVAQSYVNNATNFLFSGKWHGTDIDIVRNVINAHELVLPNEQPAIDKAIKDFKRQIGEKLAAVGNATSNIFVSYSHLDKKYLSVVQEACDTLQKENQIAYFDDTYINAGDEWEQRIKYALENASIAILLISKNFLASDYIKTIEEPKIVDRFKRNKLNIIPILVNRNSELPAFLNRLQFLNLNDPLDEIDNFKKKNIADSLIKSITSLNKEGEINEVSS